MLEVGGTVEMEWKKKNGGYEMVHGVVVRHSIIERMGEKERRSFSHDISV